MFVFFAFFCHVMFYYFHYVLLCFSFSFVFGFCFVSSPLLSLQAGIDPMITVSKPLKGQSQVLKLRSASSIHCVLYEKKCNTLWPIKKLFNAFTPEYSFTVPFCQMAGWWCSCLNKTVILRLRTTLYFSKNTRYKIPVHSIENMELEEGREGELGLVCFCPGKMEFRSLGMG